MTDPSTQELVQALRASLMDVERLERQTQRQRQERHEPIAIVGMGCRYPGGVRSPRGLWKLLAEGGDAISPLPRDRGWELASLYDPDPDRPGKTYVREGGFVEDATGFDASFFGIGPREAMAMDPQQRKLLEVCWEALEEAGIDPLSLKGSPTGVFAGVTLQDYLRLASLTASDTEGYGITGGSTSVVSGRVAYTLGLEGPAVSVDTACSSSLVALHLACRALRSGECSLALAGGATVLATPGVLVMFARQRGLARDGRCKAFADSADGTAWGEGAGVVVLERLSDALANERNILATIRASTVNQDGASNGLAAPNGTAQQRAVAQALAEAGLTPDEVQAVEAHGTGTALGDPIEAHALIDSYGQDRDPTRPLWLGSIKSNIGHTQAAAGVAGVIKMVLALRHELLPKTLHAEQPSRQVDWSGGGVALLREAVPWPAGEVPRRAGVSAFGVSGTNVHMILEEAPSRASGSELHEHPSHRDAAGVAGGLSVWTLSARGPAALRAQGGALLERIGELGATRPADVGRSLAARADLEDRAALICSDEEQLHAALAALADDDQAPGLLRGRAGAGGPATAIMFTGQGSQRVGMGRALYEAFPAFRAALDEACGQLDPLLGCSVAELALGEAGGEGRPGEVDRGRPGEVDRGGPGEVGRLDRTANTQAALFALEVALFRLVEALGVRAGAAIGHSIGELVAVHVAGALSLQEACRLVVARGQAMEALPGGGAMVSIAASEAELLYELERLSGWEQRVAIAAVNGPGSVVLSGEEPHVLELAERFAAIGRATKRLRVSHAFHSPLMDGMLDRLADVAGGLTFERPRIPVVSNVTGKPLTAEQLVDPRYWSEHVRRTVRFADGVRWLREHGHRRFFELGPAGVLAAMCRECLAGGDVDAVVTAALRRRSPEVGSLLGALGELWVDGAAVDWRALYEDSNARSVSLPTYTFQRERFWLADAAAGSDASAIGMAATGHPLLGGALPLAGGGSGVLLAGRVSLESHPWLAGHVLSGTALFPGTGMLELALHAASTVGCGCVQELTLEAPLTLEHERAAQLQVSVGEPDEHGRRSIEIYARSQPGEDVEEALEHPWTRYASGVVAGRGVDSSEDAERNEDDERNEGAELLTARALIVGSWPPSGAEQLDLDDLYDDLAGLGFDYGPSFQAVRTAWRHGESLLVDVALPEGSGGESFGLHPILLDAAVHSLLLQERSSDSGLARVPFAWRKARLHLTGTGTARVPARACLSPVGEDEFAVALADSEGRPLASIDAVVLREVSTERMAGASSAGRRSLFGLSWQIAQLEEASEPVPDLVLVDCTRDAADERRAQREGSLTQAAQVNRALAKALGALQSRLAQERSEARCVFLTSGAVAVDATEPPPSVAGSALWGLLRSAQAEHPGRLLLVDLDPRDPGRDSLPAAVAGAFAADEPQIALREGKLFVPRLRRMSAEETTGTNGAASEPAARFDGESSVLITGGTGALGARVARHLVAAHGVRSLILASRRGSQAPGAKALCEELAALGAQVAVSACDVCDRSQLERLLASLPPERPLGAVVHAAGMIEDGLVDSLTPESLERALSAKLVGALHLHELTQGLELGAFVLFSAAGGILGGAGQGGYAAANAALDALALWRRAHGQAGLSIAWGLWSGSDGMSGALSDAAKARLGRLGIRALSQVDGLVLLDAACAAEEPLAVPIAFDRAVLRRAAATGTLPALLRGIAPAPPRRIDGRSPLSALVGADARRRDAILLELVRTEAAAVLGHGSPERISVARPFKELGFDSLAAVELRNRLELATGLRLAATVVFDHPSVEQLARRLARELLGEEPTPQLATALANRSDEPLAIVGMACRYPGGVDSPQALWELVASGVDAIGAFPRNRGWDLEGIYDPDPDRHGTTYVREGGFMEDAASFDAAFFGISPREALAMDPQQRLLLESCWEACEDAGIDPLSLKGEQAGVFTGVMYHDYAMGSLGTLPGELEGYLVTGSSASVASGRIAYTLGLQGPAMTLDTACSSSLVALHLACGSLRNGECSLALAGGVTVLSTPSVFVGFARQRGLAADARCKSYSDAADGTSWSEGVGMLLVERLSDARRLGHRIYALVRGSAVNQDGASNGLTAPNGPAQERVIRQALADARMPALKVEAVEGHGTGTPLGDPIEVGALSATYGAERSVERPLWLGSIKSNIGHTQAAAGVAGVIKMAMAFRHELLPPTLHADPPSRNVQWSDGGVALLGERVSWPSSEEPRRAAVSSFGVSGTNAHVILEQPPADGAPVRSRPVQSGTGAARGDLSSGMPEDTGEAPPCGLLAHGDVPLMLSAKGPRALCGQAARLGRALEGAQLDPLDAGRSLCDRPRLPDRAVILGDERGALLDALRSLADGRSSAQLIGPSTAPDGPGEVAFVFPGQGAQWRGMARELFSCGGVFAACVQECEQALAPHVDWSLLDVLNGKGEAASLERVDVVQPALFAVMVGLARLWRACGVSPAAVVGHSQGEIAAACVAGGLSLADAARLVALRSRALLAIAGAGTMASVALPEEELASRLQKLGGEAWIAAVNGPRSAVVSGRSDTVAQLVAACQADGVRARTIPVDYAAHSPHVERVEGELLDACRAIVPAATDVPFYSSVTGGLLDTGELDARYWYRNLREPVRFDSALRAAIEAGCRTAIEVSPHPVLAPAVDEIAQTLSAPGGGESANTVGPVGSLRRDEGDPHRFLLSLAQVWTRGHDVDWDAVFAGSEARRTRLPTYAFQRERYWLNAGLGVADAEAVGQSRSEHPLLGAAVELPDEAGWLFTGRLSLDAHPWLSDHAVMGIVLLPGSALLELALHAGARAGCAGVRELTLHAPLTVDEGETIHMQVAVGRPDEQGARRIEIHSRPRPGTAEAGAAGWIKHASGQLAMVPVSHVEALAGPWPVPGAVPVQVDGLYDRLAELGLDYGTSFRAVRAAWRHGEQLFAEVSAGEQDAVRTSGFQVHPALLDAALHMALDLWGENADRGLPRVPFEWTGVVASSSSAERLRVALAPLGPASFSLHVSDERGEPVLCAESVMTRAVSPEQLQASMQRAHRSLLTLQWPLAHVAPARLRVDELVLLGARDGAVARSLRDSGAEPAIRASTDALARELDGGASPPRVVLLDCTEGGASGEDVRALLSRVLAELQLWLSEERLSSSRLALLTRGALCAQPSEDVPNLAAAALWGMARSAQLEHPGRFVLIDVDERFCQDALAAALAADEPQVAIRDGDLRVPRLAGVPLEGRADGDLGPTPFSNGATVLMTGGTGELGGLVAEHLVARRGVRSLLLVGRRGEQAAGARELRERLVGMGADVRIAACDVADREQLRELLDSIPAERPLRAVVHAANVLDDGVIESLTDERVAQAIAPKVDGALNLHELTRELPLEAFVLFSSACGVLGSAGQGSYAAANCVLDALAAHRRAQGLPAQSLAWGLWAGNAGDTRDGAGRTTAARMASAGFLALSEQEGLDLLDAAWGLPQSLVLPIRFDLLAMRAQARLDAMPAVLRGLVRLPPRDSENGSLLRRLASAPGKDREAVLADALRAELAGVLGHASSAAIDLDRTFKDMGFDSLAAVELRNRLSTMLKMSLSATLVFDHPTPRRLAAYLLTLLADRTGDAHEQPGERQLREAMASIPLTRLREAGMLEPLLALAGGDALGGLPADEDQNGHRKEEEIDAMDVESLVRAALQDAEAVSPVGGGGVDEHDA
jgi:acyl transferase domain-containing protein/acyl carrier protein